jgi:hypothetical protein
MRNMYWIWNKFLFYYSSSSSDTVTAGGAVIAGTGFLCFNGALAAGAFPRLQSGGHPQVGGQMGGGLPKARTAPGVAKVEELVGVRATDAARRRPKVAIPSIRIDLISFSLFLLNLRAFQSCLNFCRIARSNFGFALQFLYVEKIRPIFGTGRGGGCARSGRPAFGI